MFQHTAARRRLRPARICPAFVVKFQHTAARRRLPVPRFGWKNDLCRFNTQPPGGGCYCFRYSSRVRCVSFQHTAARRRLLLQMERSGCLAQFQHTAARRRLHCIFQSSRACAHCFNTQPPGGGCHRYHSSVRISVRVSTHSRPEAAAWCAGAS